jgi:hypothetical protein
MPWLRSRPAFSSVLVAFIYQLLQRSHTLPSALFLHRSVQS